MKPEYQALQQEMADRMRKPDVEGPYGKRIATVEPVFAQLQEGMGFRRVSSRNEASVLAEITLEVLAYDLGRIVAARRLRRVRVALACSSTL